MKMIMEISDDLLQRAKNCATVGRYTSSEESRRTALLLSLAVSNAAPYREPEPSDMARNLDFLQGRIQAED